MYEIICTEAVGCVDNIICTDAVGCVLIILFVLKLLDVC